MMDAALSQDEARDTLATHGSTELCFSVASLDQNGPQFVWWTLN